MLIKQLRDKIDKIDAGIIKKLAQRKALSLKTGKLKAKSDKKVLDVQREAALMLRYEKLCAEYQLDAIFVKKIFKIIITNSRTLQK